MRALIEARLRSAAVPPHPVQSMQVADGQEPSEELQRRLAGPYTPAAVLIGLIEREHDVHVLLTRRATHLSRHAGQIAFPGGRVDPGDSSAEATALREAHEEVGLPPPGVELVGRMADHITGTGFVVTPVIGFISPDFVARPDPGEVAGVFEIALTTVFSREGLRVSVQERYGSQLRGYELIHEGERIWGATAAMLENLRKLLYETE